MLINIEHKKQLQAQQDALTEHEIEQYLNRIGYLNKRNQTLSKGLNKAMIENQNAKRNHFLYAFGGFVLGGTLIVLTR